MSKRIIHWLDDYTGDPVLLHMTPVQIEHAALLFKDGEGQEDMSVLDAYLKTMPVVENGWICTDMFDGAHVFNASGKQF